MMQASRQLIDVMRGLQTADSEMLRALETAEQAIGNVLERTEEQQQMAAQVGQCIQSLQWMALQREADYELADRGSTATSSVWRSDRVDREVQTALTVGCILKKEEDEWMWAEEDVLRRCTA